MSRVYYIDASIRQFQRPKSAQKHRTSATNRRCIAMFIKFHFLLALSFQRNEDCFTWEGRSSGNGIDSRMFVPVRGIVNTRFAGPKAFSPFSFPEGIELGEAK